MENLEIKTSDKTKEEIVEVFSLRVTTPSRAREPVLEVANRNWQILEHSQDQSVTPCW